MPPRAKKAAQEPTVTAVFTDAEPTDVPDAKEHTAKQRKDRVKAEDAVVLSDFVVSTGAPAIVRKTARDNPFLEALGVSYEANQEAADAWTRFTTAEDAAENQARLIRAAAALLQIGSAVRVGNEDAGTGEVAPEGQTFVWFRGQEKKTRKAKDEASE